MSYYPKALVGNYFNNLELIIPKQPQLKKSILGITSTEKDVYTYRIENSLYESSIKENKMIEILKDFFDFESHKFNLWYLMGQKENKFGELYLQNKNRFTDRFFGLFYEILKNNFGRNIYDVFYFTGSLSRKNTFLTDFAFYDPNPRLLISIEIVRRSSIKKKIDENLISQVNYVENTEKEHDDYFLSRGCFILKFSEEQIVLYPHACCKILAKLIFQITFEHKYLKKLLNVYDLPFEHFLTDNKIVQKSDHKRTYLSKELLKERTFFQTDKLQYIFLYSPTGYLKELRTFNLLGEEIEKLEYDSAGKIKLRQKKKYQDGKVIECVLYEISIERIPKISKIWKYVYTNNILSKIICIDNEGKVKTDHYSYDSNQNLITIVEEADNIMKTVLRKEYSNNLLVKWDTFDNNSLKTSSYYSYDAKSNLVLVEEKNSLNKITGFISYSYNEKKQIIEERLDTPNFKQVKLYTYDSNGNQAVIIYKGDSIYINKMVYDNNNRLTEIFSGKNDNDLSLSDRYEYYFYIDENLIES